MHGGARRPDRKRPPRCRTPRRRAPSRPAPRRPRGCRGNGRRRRTRRSASASTIARPMRRAPPVTSATRGMAGGAGNRRSAINGPRRVSRLPAPHLGRVVAAAARPQRLGRAVAAQADAAWPRPPAAVPAPVSSASSRRSSSRSRAASSNSRSAAAARIRFSSSAIDAFRSLPTNSVGRASRDRGDGDVVLLEHALQHACRSAC